MKVRALELVVALAGCASSSVGPVPPDTGASDVGLEADGPSREVASKDRGGTPDLGDGKQPEYTDFVDCEGRAVPGAACGATRLPCFSPALTNGFNCGEIDACTCVSGKVQCAPVAVASLTGRQCAPTWGCYAEGMPFCNYDKPWWACHCDATGHWVCGDECQRLGCPEGSYPGPSATRAFTGDPCTVEGALCPYRIGFTAGTVCTCTGGRFSCSGDPVPDGGAADAPRD